MSKRKQHQSNQVSPADLQLITVVQAMAILGIGRTKLYDLINNDGLPTVKIGSLTKVPLVDLKVWIDQRKTLVVV